MRVSVSGRIGEDVSTAYGLLNRLFPNAIISDMKDIPLSFKVVTLEEVVNGEEAVPRVTLRVLQQMIDQNESHLTFPTHGLINIHLFRKKIAFSGFGSQQKRSLYLLAQRMGAYVDKVISSRTTVLVATSRLSRRVDFCKSRGIPVVSMGWLEALTESPEYIDPQRFELGPLSGCIFTPSNLEDQIETIREIVNKGGGRVSEVMTTRTTHLVIPEQCNSNRTSIAINYGLPLVTIDLLEKAVRFNQTVDPIVPPFIVSKLFEGYSFSVGGTRANYLISLITRHGGAIVTNASCEYAVEKYSDGAQLRTGIWVERCIEVGKVLPGDMFDGFIYTAPIEQKLTNQTICLCGFESVDFMNNVALLKWLGASVSMKIDKHTNVLIAANKCGRMYSAAVAWGVQVVDPSWLDQFLPNRSVPALISQQSEIEATQNQLTQVPRPNQILYQSQIQQPSQTTQHPQTMYQSQTIQHTQRPQNFPSSQLSVYQAQTDIQSLHSTQNAPTQSMQTPSAPLITEEPPAPRTFLNSDDDDDDSYLSGPSSQHQSAVVRENPPIQEQLVREEHPFLGSDSSTFTEEDLPPEDNPPERMFLLSDSTSEESDFNVVARNSPLIAQQIQQSKALINSQQSQGGGSQNNRFQQPVNPPQQQTMQITPQFNQIPELTKSRSQIIPDTNNNELAHGSENNTLCNSRSSSVSSQMNQEMLISICRSISSHEQAPKPPMKRMENLELEVFSQKAPEEKRNSEECDISYEVPELPEAVSRIPDVDPLLAVIESFIPNATTDA